MVGREGHGGTGVGGMPMLRPILADQRQLRPPLPRNLRTIIVPHRRDHSSPTGSDRRTRATYVLMCPEGCAATSSTSAGRARGGMLSRALAPLAGWQQTTPLHRDCRLATKPRRTAVSAESATRQRIVSSTYEPKVGGSNPLGRASKACTSRVFLILGSSASARMSRICPEKSVGSLAFASRAAALRPCLSGRTHP